MFWYILVLIILAVAARLIYLRQRRKAAWEKMCALRDAYNKMLNEDLAEIRQELKWLEREVGAV